MTAGDDKKIRLPQEHAAATSNGAGKSVSAPPDKPALPKRFYKSVAVKACAEGHAVVLDDRPVRTPKRQALSVAWSELAEALAGEWSAQRDVIDPTTMPLTKLVNTAIDGVRAEMEEVAGEVVRFAGNDLLCYRASSPAGLVANQNKLWNPVLHWAETRLGAKFLRVEGVMPVEQSPETLETVARTVAKFDAFGLTGLHVLTTLTGSALLALSYMHGEMTCDEVWLAANVDDDWQISQWGEDAEASVRRQYRLAELEAACRLLSLSGNVASA